MKVKTAFLTTRDSNGNPQIGDCIVISFGEKFADEERKACIVIDGGYSTTKVVLKNYLEKENIKIIDLMVATHIDNDHISGLKSFLQKYVREKNGERNKFELRNYWGPAPKTFESISITEFLSYIINSPDFGIEDLSFISQSVAENEKLCNTVKEILTSDHIFYPSVEVRDSIPKIFNSIAIDILAPDKQIPDDKIKGKRVQEVSLGNTLAGDSVIDLTDAEIKKKVNEAALENNRTANNQSIVFKLTPLDSNGQRIEDCTFLFTGDAEEESWEFMIDKWGEDLNSELLKVSHHGSRTGTSNHIMNMVKPKYCIVCAGKNTHGLPDEDVLKIFSEKNLKIFCTGRNPNKEESPCTKKKILKKCPRWDYTNEKHIKDTIIFEVDADTQSMTYTGKPCGFDW
jgi:beta-lactamase superfamily II metal-dependent hydrolase